MIRFRVQTDVLIGNGTFRTLPRFLRERGFSRPAVLIDEGFMRSPLWQEVERSLREEFSVALIVHGRRGNAEPTYEDLDQLAAIYRPLEFDVLVGVGGGSAMDLAKGVAALRTNMGRAIDYRGFDKLVRPAIPTVLVPTTAGTGSEVTINASYIDTESKRKLGINGRFMSAAYAILDAETTISCPYSSALGAGIDAFVHTAESFAARQHNQVTRMFAREAARLLVAALPSLKLDPSNLDRRLDLLIGAYYAGTSLFNSGSGIASGLSYPLGVHFRVPHGIGGGIFCLDVMDYNIEHGYFEYAELARVVGITAGTDEAQAREFLRRMREMFALLGVPRKLTEVGLNPGQYPALVEHCGILQGAFDQNPVPFSVTADMPGLIQKFF